MNSSQHIEKLVKKYTSEQIAANRLRIQVSIDVVHWLAFQACAFKGHDESVDSLNRGNCIELIQLLASYNDKIARVVLQNALSNASYTSSQIQKKILSVISSKVKKAIGEEIGVAIFFILVDEARDESKKEKMALILRFVDKDGFICERFFDLVRVKDTTSLTLRDGIFKALSHHELVIQNIRSQGYDSASNMRGEWNGLQALIFTTSSEVSIVHQFFNNLTSIINTTTSSSKRNDELKDTQAIDVARKLANNEIESGRGLNQIGTLKQAGDTQWGSHLYSISNLIKISDATYKVLENLSTEGNYHQRGDADLALNSIMSFEFIFILHLMKDIMEITEVLSQVLQQKSQDILNAMDLVSSAYEDDKNREISKGKSCYHRIKCTAATFLATLIWRKPLNSAVSTTATQGVPTKILDEMYIQVNV
ncbi:uncharacterized protein LOC112015301 [Quercus suber]|uniref:uncharacterized protein LOC112015301 n=1 Tax=Quercus suber TaxID=58331 RepID=UPI0032DFB698